MSFEFHSQIGFEQFEQYAPTSEKIRQEDKKFINNYKFGILSTGGKELYAERYKRAAQISEEASTDHNGFINYLAVLLFQNSADETVHLPAELHLERFKSVFQKIHQQQTNHQVEFARTAYIDWRSMRLRFTETTMGDTGSVVQQGYSEIAHGEFPSFSIHTHPTIAGEDKNYPLHFSHGDFFTFETGIFGAAAVICDAGALLLVKRNGAVSPRTAGETLGIIKEEMFKAEASDKRTPGQAIRAFTGSMCRRLGYDLYRISDLDEMVARRINLEES